MIPFHIVLLVSGIVAATYRSSPKNQVHHANRRAFVTLQYQTYVERKATSDTMFETSSLSAKAVQARLRSLKKKEKEEKPPKVKKIKPKKDKKRNKDNEGWDEIQAGDDD